MSTRSTGGRFALLLAEHEQIWAFTRTLGDDTLLVVANCSSLPAEIPPALLPALDGAELLGTHDDATASTLAPWESRSLHLRPSP
ncbi:MAG: alpha-glucosidase C-terminal domain-containing protein [Propionicimonas sp.]